MAQRHAGASRGRHAAHRNPLYGAVRNASRVCRPRADRRLRHIMWRQMPTGVRTIRFRQPGAASEGLRSIPAIREQCHGIVRATGRGRGAARQCRRALWGAIILPFQSCAPLASPRLVALSCSPLARLVSPDEPPKRSQGRSRQWNRDHQGADEDCFPVHGWHGALVPVRCQDVYSCNRVFHSTGRAPPVIWKWCVNDESGCPSHRLA